MPIPLGILAQAGRSIGGGGSYELIESVILTSTQSSVTFSNLGNYSSTYQHLQIRGVARDDRPSVVLNNAFIRLNGDTGANYSYHYLLGDGSSVSSAAGISTNEGVAGSSVGSSGATNIFAPLVVDILDAYESKNKTIRAFTGINASSSTVRLWSSAWRNTASLTTILLFPSSGASFVSGSRFSLYGVKG